MINETRVRGKSDLVEEVYMDFAQKVSKQEGTVIFFTYNFLQYLFNLAPYATLDLNLSNIAYSDYERIEESTIALKNGMKLKFKRVKISRYIYVLNSLEFSWKGNKYKYSCPEMYDEIKETCKITLDEYKG